MERSNVRARIRFIGAYKWLAIALCALPCLPLPALAQSELQTFKLADANGDGVIDIAEGDRHVDANFKRRDLNQDGFVTAAEFEQWMVNEAVGQGGRIDDSVRQTVLRPAAANEVMMYDKNADGLVSPAEYREGSRKMFDHMDRDGDGKVTFKEYQARREPDDPAK